MFFNDLSRQVDPGEYFYILSQEKYCIYRLEWQFLSSYTQEMNGQDYLSDQGGQRGLIKNVDT